MEDIKEQIVEKIDERFDGLESKMEENLKGQEVIEKMEERFTNLESKFDEISDQIKLLLERSNEWV